MIKHIPILPPRYRFSGLANSGGYGTAYHCEDVNLKRDVIVKTISKPTDFHKLINEIHSLQRTKSNHVVQIYDVIRDSDGDPCAIVEEYLPGDDLTNFKIDAVTAHEFLMILYQIITGIHDMHACSVVHRDIKFNNVKFDAEGMLKIFDLNLSRHTMLPGRTIGYGGTRGFMAPELFPPYGTIDKPVDCYSFASLVHYLIYNDTPPCTQHEPPIPPTTSDSISNHYFFNSKLAGLIDRCHLADPNARPSAQEIKDEISRELLHNRHKALVTLDDRQREISAHSTRLGVKTGQSRLVIVYDGYQFIATEVHGDIFVNQQPLAPGDAISGSSILIFGSPELEERRHFVSFDVSQPEVVL